MLPLLKERDFDALITNNRFTLVNRNAEEMMDYAKSKGIAVLNAAPYAGGVLAKGSATHKRYVYQEASAETREPVTRVEKICAKYGIPPGAAALQFSMRDPRVASTVCGISKPDAYPAIDWPATPFRKPPGMNSCLPYEARPGATRVYSPAETPPAALHSHPIREISCRSLLPTDGRNPATTSPCRHLPV